METTMPICMYCHQPSERGIRRKATGDWVCLTEACADQYLADVAERYGEGFWEKWQDAVILGTKLSPAALERLWKTQAPPTVE